MSQSAEKGGFMPFYRWKQLTLFTDSIFWDINYIVKLCTSLWSYTTQNSSCAVLLSSFILQCWDPLFLSQTEFITDFFFPSWADFEGKVRLLRMSAIKNVAGHKDQELTENKAELYKLRIKYHDHECWLVDGGTNVSLVMIKWFDVQ